MMAKHIHLNMTNQGNVLSQNNLTLCKADYFETCWCPPNRTEPTTCPYLLRHVVSLSNASVFCLYHTIRKTVECFNASSIFPTMNSASSIYVYSTLLLFLMGFLGNGFSMIVLFGKTLRPLSVYRNLFILCGLNILYLFAVLIRHTNPYEQDLRLVSFDFCRYHTFIVAFTGHLCSWQLVSTSIQRVHALLSLQSHGTTSWIHTCATLLIAILLPLSLFDGQLLFKYGLLKHGHMCDHLSNHPIRQFQRARHFPISNSTPWRNVSVRYHGQLVALQTMKLQKCRVCILWNLLDIFVYAIIPFIIILTCSLIIIVKICERRRSTINSGGICHTSRRVNLAHDHLSILLIAINCLFLIMTGPFNVSLIVQSIGRFCSVNPVPPLITSRTNEYLRVLQNSYHAFSFIFYCVIGNKFRDSACSVCGRNQHKLSPFAHDRSQLKSSSILCCVRQKNSFNTAHTFVTPTHSKHTLPTTSMQFTHLQKHSPILSKSMQHLNTAL